MKIIKWIFILVGVLLLLGVLGIGAFIYKAKYGFNSYETTPHELPAEMKSPAVLILNKTNGFRHGEAIEASQIIFESLCKENNWFCHFTEDAGVFNEQQLELFDVVVFNNCTGKVLNPDQRSLFKSYIESGGGFVGIHGAGDDSHQWDWYEEVLIGAHFSHHPLDPQLQTGKLYADPAGFSPLSFKGLPSAFEHKDEWYVFYDNPKENGATVLYSLDEEGLVMDGTLPLIAPDKNFGMNGDHPIIWYKEVGNGRSLYSGLGHNAEAMRSETYQRILVKAIEWAGKLRANSELRMMSAPTM